jgi:3-methyladenine DNA glycosylase AlkD
MSIVEELQKASKNSVPIASSYYHKTKEGDYQHGDIFWNITVPDIRAIAKRHRESVLLPEIEKLLESEVHELRLCGLILLGDQVKKANEFHKKNIVSFYLDHLDFVNGWDLVDLSAPNILGQYLYNAGTTAILDELAVSPDLWRRRVAIVSTLALIRHNELDATFRVTTRLLHDKEDLIHKACGWMLRETGKRDRGRLNNYLQVHYNDLPRTTLRYAIEKHEESERKSLLKGHFREE